MPYNNHMEGCEDDSVVKVADYSPGGMARCGHIEKKDHEIAP